MSACFCRFPRLLNISRCVTFSPKIQERQIKRWVSPTLRELKRRAEYRPRYIKPVKPILRTEMLEWNLNIELYAFKKRLNEDFKDDLLLQAFTHKEYLIREEIKQKAVGIENPEIKMSHNEELADEGEEFMRQYMSSYLSVALPRFPGEGIASITNHLASQETMGHIGLNLGCKDIILSDEYPVSEATLAKTFRAIVGALLHSSGPERTAHFVRDFVITQLNGKDVNDYWNIEDPIQMLSDILEKNGESNIEYRLITQTGVNTLLACYHIGLYVNKQHFASGYGETVAIAKEMTARDGLINIFGTQENMPPLDFKIKGVLNENLSKIKATN